MEFETIKFKKNDAFAVITISREKAMNALNSQVLSDLDQALTAVEREKEIRALLITGAGDRAFVAGADIKEIHELNPDSAMGFAQKGQNLFTRIETFPTPVIAVVNGFALGGGLELAMACDFIVASEKAKMGLPECTLGLIPGFGGTVRLARKVGPGLAKQWTMTGDMITADEAFRSGLVNKVCAPADLLPEAEKIALTIASRAPLAVSGIKKCINQTYGMDIIDAMKIEAGEFSALFNSEDCKEGTAAFIEKRKADFKGR